MTKDARRFLCGVQNGNMGIIGAGQYAKMEILDRALLAAGMEEFQR
jgi:hypothetical protein